MKQVLEVSKVSCHTKFRFAEREAQSILGECGPLIKSERKISFHKTRADKIKIKRTGEGVGESRRLSASLQRGL